MKVVIAAIGSRGDVVPFGHLARRFASSGHEVSLVTHEGFGGRADSSVRVIDVPSDPQALLAGPSAQAVRRVSPRALNRTRHVFADFVQSAHLPARAVLPGADVLIASTFAIAAVDEALRQQVRVVRAHLWPEYAGLGGPMPLLPYAWHMPKPLRRVARRMLRRAEPYLGGVHGSWRRGRLHLIARHPVGLTRATSGSLYALSPRVVDHLPERGLVTGWWTAPSSGRLSDDVAYALEDGNEWIHVGFGSMHQADPNDLLAQLGSACARAGVRAVVQLGDLRGTPHPNLLCIGEEPHDVLFRKVRAVVHHGGAGTTSAAVRAGVPSVVVPHFADQFYWGRRLRSLGVAARPVPRALLSARGLARRLEEALTADVRRRARSLAERVGGEDGCGLAVRQVEEWLADAVHG